jgi:succinate dehydrogenase flavin-adding protein (antitoxin of CptAB toxin-antitoxin module)
MKNTISKAERDLINLSTGKKRPKTEKDQKLADQIQEIKRRGGKIYIPHD